MNPFENESYRFYALRNAEGQYSIWPVFALVPQGWEIMAEGTRTEALDHITTTWVDMRPNSLVEAMGQARDVPDLTPV
ncbi:MAG: MbtH family protein [Dermatophilaceae bacterium]